MERKAVFAILLALIMVSSIFGFVFSYGSSGNGGNTLEYNDVTFYQTEQGWRTTVHNEQLLFQFFPEQIDTIQLSADVQTVLDKTAWIVTYDPSSEQAEILATAQYYTEQQLRNEKTIVRATTSDKGYNLPVLDCANGTTSQPVLLYAIANETRITAENNCIIVTGKDIAELVRAAERIQYHIFEVIE